MSAATRKEAFHPQVAQLVFRLLDRSEMTRVLLACLYHKRSGANHLEHKFSAGAIP
jgi:hypothetical protein